MRDERFERLYQDHAGPLFSFLVYRTGDRAIWQIGAAQVFDGGPDGVASTSSGNTMFMDQGIFVP